jgi:hypothetical protein
MDNYKLFTWTAGLPHGPSFDISFIALTADEAHTGLFKQFEEIKAARLMDKGELEPIYFKARIHTEFISDMLDVNLLDFTEDMELDNGCPLGEYILYTSPDVRDLNLARIMINTF